jgi:hypothetical protein
MEDPIIVEGESMDAPLVLDEPTVEDLAPRKEEPCQHLSGDLHARTALDIRPLF